MGGVGVTEFTDGVIGEAIGVVCCEGLAAVRGVVCATGTWREAGTGICILGTGMPWTGAWEALLTGEEAALGRARGDLWVPAVNVGIDTLFRVVCGAREGDFAGRIAWMML